MFQEGMEQEAPHESGFLVQSRVSVEEVQFPPELPKRRRHL